MTNITGADIGIEKKEPESLRSQAARIMRRYFDTLEVNGVLAGYTYEVDRRCDCFSFVLLEEDGRTVLTDLGDVISGLECDGFEISDDLLKTAADAAKPYGVTLVGEEIRLELTPAMTNETIRQYGKALPAVEAACLGFFQKNGES